MGASRGKGGGVAGTVGGEGGDDGGIWSEGTVIRILLSYYPHDCSHYHITASLLQRNWISFHHRRSLRLCTRCWLFLFRGRRCFVCSRLRFMYRC